MKPATRARLDSTPDLDAPSATYDGALYIASCLGGSGAPDGAVIYCTTKREVADPETGELYLVFRAHDTARYHLDPAEGWREIATFSVVTS